MTNNTPPRKRTWVLSFVAIGMVIVSLVLAMWLLPTPTIKTVTPLPSATTHELKSLSVPMIKDWSYTGNEEEMSAEEEKSTDENEPGCTNEYGKGCGKLLVSVKGEHVDPNNILEQYLHGCERKAEKERGHTIGLRAAEYYVISPCFPEPRTSSPEVRHIWHIRGKVTAVLTYGLDLEPWPQERMTARVDEALADATWK